MRTEKVPLPDKKAACFSQRQTSVKPPPVTTVTNLRYNWCKTTHLNTQDFRNAKIIVIKVPLCGILGGLKKKKKLQPVSLRVERWRENRQSEGNQPPNGCLWSFWGEIDSLMARPASCVISFWCDRPVMISELAACSKELSAGTFNYRGDWFGLWSPPRLVFISNCRLTVKQHYQRCHPKPKLLVYKNSRGPDYHSVSGSWATVALFLLTTPLCASHFPSFLFLCLLSFKYLSAHIKKKSLMSSAHATCSISDKSEPGASLWEGSY